ncbi:MAG: HAMP domain-containing protein [Desulfobacteraceae bacterium]|nr:HAMP domain-containing protein [Desulfobacteraceae bacterium]
MRIKTRIQLGIILSLVLAATIALLLFLGARAVNEASRLDEITAEVVKGVAELKNVTHEYILHPEERSLMQWRSRYGSLSKILTGGHFKSPDEKIVADQVFKNLERFKTVFFDLTSALRKGEALGKQASADFRELQDRLMGELLVKSQAAVSVVFQLHQEIEAKSVTTQKRVSLLTVLLLLTLTAAIVGISLWVNRSVARPIAKLEKDTQIIGSGNLDHKVGTTAKDEIGELSRAFDKMTGDLKETTTSIVELNKEIDERRRAEESLKESYKELKAMQGQLVRHEKLAVLGQIAGSVGHELRNPLGVISNAIYFLQMTLSEAEETTKEYLEIISSEVSNADNIVSGLLDFSRVKSVGREETGVSELVSQVLEKKPAPENVEVASAIPPDLPAVFVDPMKIGQVVINLVTNAYQAMPDGGRLTVRARGERDKVSLSIIDTGCGISKENMKNIFEPLFTTRARGIGLGLAVARNLAEANGGSIRVESEEGKGSTFTLILPTREAIS